MSTLERDFRVVLCRPRTSANIGFVCRAMKTMGLRELAIVGDAEKEDVPQVEATAVHAAGIYHEALRFESLREAVADCVLAAGTTRRRGKSRKRAIMLPEQFARMTDDIGGTVALVFGNEEAGLTTAELSVCSVAITIPSDPEFPSLNLSHAVQILTYVLYRHRQHRPSYSPVLASRVERAVESMIDNLDVLGYFHLMGSDPTRRLLTEVIGRAAVTEGELRELERIFRKLRYRGEERNAEQ